MNAIHSIWVALAVFALQFDPEGGATKILVLLAIPALVLAIVGRVAYTWIRYRMRRRNEKTGQGGGRRTDWTEPPDRDDDRGERRGRRGR